MFDATRQFEEGERVAVALHDDLVANSIIQRPREVLKQQRSCVLVPKSVDRQLRKATRTSSPMPLRTAHTIAIRSARSRRATNADDLRRRLVKPLRVVDDARERALLGDRGEERQGCEPHHEPVRRRA